MHASTDRRPTAAGGAEPLFVFAKAEAQQRFQRNAPASQQKGEVVGRAVRHSRAGSASKKEPRSYPHVVASPHRGRGLPA